jgi:hypothetical protein
MKFNCSRQQRLAFVTLALTGLVLSLFAWLPIKSIRANQSFQLEQLSGADLALEINARTDRGGKIHFLLLAPTITIFFGQNGDLPLTGDWNGDGIDTNWRLG